MTPDEAHNHLAAVNGRSPRAWQVEAFPIGMACLRAREAAVLSICTGAGKTDFCAGIAAAVAGGRLRESDAVLVTVPRQDLVRQTVEQFKARGLPVGAYYADRKRAGARIVVACQDSLPSLVDEFRLHGRRTVAWIADEVHRASTDTVLQAMAQIDPLTRLAVTATPYRSDAEQPIVGWERVAYSYPIDRAISDGVLVPWVPVTWDDEEADVTDATIAMILQHDPQGPGVVSATDIDDAEWCAGELRAAGINAEAIHSRLSRPKRAAIMRRLVSGETRCLVHVDLLTEGVDIPELRWLVMRRERRSHVAIVQEVGRVLRTSEDRWGRKAEALLFIPRPPKGSAGSLWHALRRDPALALTPEEHARALREAMEREASGPPAETILSPAQRVERYEPYARALLEALHAGGVVDRLPDWGDPVRRQAPSDRQLDMLADLTSDGRRSPVRLFPEQHRDAMRQALAVPDVLSRGAVSDLVTALLGARKALGRHAKAHAHLPPARRFGWRVRCVLPEPP